MTSHQSVLAQAVLESSPQTIQETFAFLLREYISNDAPTSALGRLLVAYKRRVIEACASARSADEKTKPAADPIVDYLARETKEAKHVRELQRSRNRDKYLDAFGTWCGPERSRKAKNQGPDKVTYVAYGYSGEPECVRRLKREPKFVDALMLAEYAAHSLRNNNEAATVLHLPHRCDVCLMFVTVLHKSKRCAAKLRAEQEHEVEMLAVRQEAKRQRHLTALAAQGLKCVHSAADDGDLNIIEDRIKHGADEVYTEFDKQLWNKSQRAKKCKHRIQ